MKEHIVETAVVEEERLEGYEVIVVGDKEIRFKLVEGVPMTSSLEVARHFEKLHKNVIKAIENDSVYNEFLNGLKIKPVEYKDKKGEIRKAYLLDRDAFAYFAMGFTGEKAKRWKLNYIKAFNEMERRLRELLSKQSIDTIMTPQIMAYRANLAKKSKEIERLRTELAFYKEQMRSGGFLDASAMEKIVQDTVTVTLQKLKAKRPKVKRVRKRVEVVVAGEGDFIKKTIAFLKRKDANQTELLAYFGKERDNKRFRELLHKYDGVFWLSKKVGKERIYTLIPTQKETA